MRFLKDGTIVCAEAEMIKALTLLTNGQTDFSHLTNPEHNGECFVFRAGAKLWRISSSRWRINGYHGRDAQTAKYELRAADHLRQAVSLLSSVDDVMCTPQKYRIKRVGLWGRYPNGQASPYEISSWKRP